jgi:hypothetical protein
MKIRIPLTKYEIHLTLRRADARTRHADLPPIIIDQQARAAAVADLGDLDSIRKRAAAMRAELNS